MTKSLSIIHYKIKGKCDNRTTTLGKISMDFEHPFNIEQAKNSTEIRLLLDSALQVEI